MIRKKLAALKQDERGATSMEYAFMLVLIFLSVVGAWGALGDEVRGIFGDHAAAMEAARKDSKTS